MPPEIDSGLELLLVQILSDALKGKKYSSVPFHSFYVLLLLFWLEI